jgi:hypothetical protein
MNNSLPSPLSGSFLSFLMDSVARIGEILADLPQFLSPLDRSSDFAPAAQTLDEATGRLGGNYPYFHTLFAQVLFRYLASALV